MPANIIQMINMKNDEKFKMLVEVEFKEQNVFWRYYRFFLFGKINGNRVTLILNDEVLENCMSKHLKNGDYTAFFSYDMSHNEDESFAPEKENNFSIEKDNDFYFVKIDAEGKQVFSKGFKDENEFEKQKDNFKEINEKIDFRNKKIIERNYFNRLVGNYADLFLKLVIFSSFFVIATFIILGLFTGGVAPAILTPLIAKCLMGMFGGIGALGFFASRFVHRKGELFEKSVDLVQNGIDNLKNEIDDLGKENEKLDVETKQEDNKDKKPMLENENEHGDR